MNSVQRHIILFSGLILWSSISIAQKGLKNDTTRKQVVDIISSYKPVLRNAVKINFSASNLNADTAKGQLHYNIPQQNLFYTYQPLPVKPLALQQDTALELGTRDFVKLGFGNYTTPYAKAGLSFGDGKKSLLNLYTDYISSQGTITNQDYSQFNLKAAGSYFTPKNEIYGNAAISQNIYNMYGYDHTLYDYPKDSVQQRFSDLSLKAGIRNKTVNGTGINYDPSLQVNLFSSQDKLTENSVIVNAPVEKTLDEEFTIMATLKADATTYSTKELPSNITLHNNVVQLAPAIQLNEQRFTLHAGISPTWDNSQLNVLPDIYIEAPIKDKIFLVQAGWVGQIIKNTYQNLTDINPYINPITSQQNTKEVEFYGGIKATISKHFNFSAKAGFVTYHNLALYLNDTLDDRSFYIKNESKANDLRIHADMSFISQDKFTITSGFTINGYTGLQDNSHAWGTIPIELDASLRWWAYKRLLIKGDFNAFGGGPYLPKGDISNTLSGGTDLSAGAELVINKQFSAWMDLNNIFNSKYQRWYNYPVYGLNVLAGVIYKF
jgi:hypothetical protein